MTIPVVVLLLLQLNLFFCFPKKEKKRKSWGGDDQGKEVFPYQSTSVAHGMSTGWKFCILPITPSDCFPIMTSTPATQAGLASNNSTRELISTESPDSLSSFQDALLSITLVSSDYHANITRVHTDINRKVHIVHCSRLLVWMDFWPITVWAQGSFPSHGTGPGTLWHPNLGSNLGCSELESSFT